MPGVFVLLWSTGFIGAKLGLPYAEPMTFLALRFGVLVLLLLPVALLWRLPWPRPWSQVGHICVSGLLLHGVYLGGVFSSIYHGVPAGVVALIVGIQPVLTAALAGSFLGERITPLQWTGLGLGILGVILVVWRKLDLGSGTPLGFGLAVLALLGITFGTLYQKRFCAHIHLVTGNLTQFAATCLALGGLAFLLESRHIIWSGRFVFALAWLVLVLSIGAITLLYLLIRRGAAARVASLFYLVPPATAVIAWILFGETFGPVALAGMVVAVTGVALVNLRR
jgi:drug/metabolite transporter (DMT)-like permease